MLRYQMEGRRYVLAVPASVAGIAETSLSQSSAARISLKGCGELLWPTVATCHPCRGQVL
jgi:hypothetical protein